MREGGMRAVFPLSHSLLLRWIAEARSERGRAHGSCFHRILPHVDRVYFTWPDRRFRYECRGCGACCKGHGIGIDVAGGQLVQLLARRPALAAFLRRRGDAITAFNPRDRCWFLADDGLCRVEVEDGRAAKPASCRLFPFNRVFRLGSYTIVDYNSVICPLTVGDDGIAHAEVAAEIAAIADPSIVGTSLPARDPEAEGRAFVESEGAIAAAIFAAPGDLSAAWLAQADPASASSAQSLARSTHPASTTSPQPATVRSAHVAEISAHAANGSLDRARELASAAFTTLLGAPWQAPSASTLAAALWLTPSMRFNELYGPRQVAPRAASAPILPRMWLAWLGFAALGEQLADRPLGLQELTTLWSEQVPLMHAVARWADVPSLKPGPIDLPSVDPGGMVRSLAQVFVDNRKNGKPLGALIAALPGDAPARVTALKTADSILRAAFAGR